MDKNGLDTKQAGNLACVLTTSTAEAGKRMLGCGITACFRQCTDRPAHRFVGNFDKPTAPKSVSIDVGASLLETRTHRQCHRDSAPRRGLR